MDAIKVKLSGSHLGYFRQIEIWDSGKVFSSNVTSERDIKLAERIANDNGLELCRDDLASEAEFKAQERVVKIQQNIKIELSVSEEHQIETLQNATTQQGAHGIVVSIAAYPKFLKCDATQQEIAAQLESQLRCLASEGWSFDIKIGAETSPEYYV